MKKLLKRKVNILGKSIPMFVIALLGVALVSAALISYFGSITGNVIVDQGLFLDGNDWDDSITEVWSDFTSLEAMTFVSAHSLENSADVNAEVELDRTCSETSGDGCEDITTTYLNGMKEGSVDVKSVKCDDGTEGCFNNETETLVLNSMAFNADTVIIEGEVSSLDLGQGWPNTAYVEIGVRPDDAKDSRNAGVYLIAFNLDDTIMRIHLQDYTGNGAGVTGDNVIDIAKSDFSYKITLNSGTATLEVFVAGELEGTVTLPYGCVGTWVEGEAGGCDEDFTKAHLFYSIIADRRGTDGQTYSATVGDIKTNSVIGENTQIIIPSNSVGGFVIQNEFPQMMKPAEYTITTEVQPYTA